MTKIIEVVTKIEAVTKINEAVTKIIEDVTDTVTSKNKDMTTHCIIKRIKAIQNR